MPGGKMRTSVIQQLTARSRGVQDARKFQHFNLDSPQPLIETAKDIMSSVQPSFGACAMLSAAWAGMLNDHYDIPAIVVAGDLKIEGKRVFKCKKNISVSGNTEKFLNRKWDGHCWIEIDGFIGDLSIFRTAYSLKHPSVLRQFIESNFGLGRGAMLSPVEDIPQGMQYIPKFVLDDTQINGLIAGLGYQLEQGI
jgi:hypothetical protein